MKTNGFDFEKYTSLGAILIRAGEITQKQLDRALKAQTNGHSGTHLGDICVKFGFCTREAVNEALEHQATIRPQESKSDEALQRLWAVADQAAEAGEKLKRTTTQKMRVLDISSGKETK